MKKKIQKAASFFAIIILLVFAYFLYDTFRSLSTEEKIAEIIHFEDQRLHSDRLNSYLEEAEPEIRRRAALAIGRIGGKNSGERLFAVIQEDASSDVAREAAFAIGLTGKKQYASKLLDIAFELPGKVAVEAVMSAGRLADSNMTELHFEIVPYLKHPSPEVREAACMSVYNAKAISLVPDLFDIFNTEPDEEVKIMALYSLARLKVSQALPLYKRYLADADPFVRGIAVGGLDNVKADEATHLLSIAANDSDPGVKSQAIAALGNKKSDEAQRQLLRKLSRADSPKIIVAILNALRAQDNDGAIAETYDIIRVFGSEYVSSAAIKYLAQFQKDRAVNLIDSLMATDSPRLKAACAESYQLIGQSTVAPRLSKLFLDASAMVRTGAFNALISIDSSNRDYYISQALSDSDYVVVASAVGQIEKNKLESYLPQLVKLIMANKKPHVDIRRSIVSLAETFLKDDKNDSLAMKILLNAAIDPEYIVRKDAARIYKEVLNKNRDNIIRQTFTIISESDLESGLEKYRTNPYATIKTNRGNIEIELYFDVAPLTVLNFIELAEDGYYDELQFHRVVPNFVAQGGDPRGDGWGGPRYYIRCEYSSEKYRRGTLGIATSGKDSGGSQFFITLSPQPHLEARYTVFGQVIAGMEYVDDIVIGDIIESIEIEENLF